MLGSFSEAEGERRKYYVASGNNNVLRWMEGKAVLLSRGLQVSTTVTVGQTKKVKDERMSSKKIVPKTRLQQTRRWPAGSQQAQRVVSTTGK